MTQSTSHLAEATTVDVSAAQKHGTFLLDVTTCRDAWGFRVYRDGLGCRVWSVGRG